MASTLHVLKAILESNVGSFVRNIESAADSVEGLGKEWESAAKTVVAAADKVDRAAAKTAREATRAAEKAARETAKAAQQAARESARAAKEMQARWIDAGRAIERSLNRTALAVGGFAVGVAGAVGKIGISFDAMQESSRIAFTTLLGDGQKALKFLEELKAFAVKTPFELPGLTQAAQKMLAFGFAAEEILPTLTAVGDAASGLGGSPEVLEAITRALGQMKAKGKVQAEEMLQLAEAGIPAWEFLANFLETDVATAMKMVTDGAVTGTQGIEALITGMNRKFGGLMAQQSLTFTGLLSTLKDTMNQAAGKVMEPAFERIRDSMKGLVDALGGPEFESAAQRLGDKVAEVVERISKSFQGISAGDVIGRLEKAISGAIDIFGRMAVSVRQVAPPLLEFGKAVSNLLGPILNLIANEPKLLQFFAIWKTASLLGISGAVTKLGSAILATSKYVTGLGTAATVSAPAMASILGPMGIFATGAALIWAAVEAIDAYNKATERRLASERKLVEMAREKEKLQRKENASTASRIAGFRGDGSLSRIASEVQALKDRRKELERQKRAAEEEGFQVAKRAERGPSPFGTRQESAQFEQDIRQQKQAVRQKKEALAIESQGVEQQLESAAKQFVAEAAEQIETALKESNLPEDMAGQFQQDFRQIQSALESGTMPLDEFVKRTLKMGADIRKEAEKLDAANAPARQAAQRAAIQKELSQQQLKKRGEAAGPEFERISGLLNRPEVNADSASVHSVAGSIEGTNQTFTQELVRRMQELRKAGKLTKDNIDAAILDVLEGIEKAKQKTKSAKEQAKTVRSELDTFQSDVAGSGASDQAKMTAQEGALSLESQFSSGQITLDSFLASLAALRRELELDALATKQESIAKAQSIQQSMALDKEQQASANKAVMTQKTMMEKFFLQLSAFSQRLTISQSAEIRQRAQNFFKAFEVGKISMEKLKFLLGELGKSAQEAANKVEKSAKKMTQTARNAFQGRETPGSLGEAASPFANFVGDFQETANQIFGFFNSQQGVIAGLQNQIAQMRQALPFLDRARDRIALEKQIAGLIGNLNDLLQPQLSPIDGINPLSGIFYDPGLSGASSGGPTGVGKAPLIGSLNFNSVSKPSAEDQRQIFDAVEQELARRGFRG